MEDLDRAIEIKLLRERLARAMAQRAALVEEGHELFARLHDIRAAFGNPFFYSHPEHADESIANYTGSSSHAVVLPTVLALRRVEDAIRHIEARLRNLGVETV